MKKPVSKQVAALYDYKGVKITWLGHDCFKIKNGKTVIIDPFKLQKDSEKADILLITHEHFDHFSIDDIKKVVSEKTIVVATRSCQNELSKLKVQEVKVVRPGDSLSVGDVALEAVSAYNINKFRQPGRVFHPKEEEKVGYVVTVRGFRVYHAGDTDAIPEMKGLKADVALLPVSGTYVMTAEEAVEATKMIGPKVAIPMHYGAIVGSEQDAEKFKMLASCQVQILRPE